MNLPSLPRRRVIRVAVVSAAVLVTPTISALPAHAQWGVCVNDPKVWLTNGTRVDMASGVLVDPSLVTQISFVLHVPAGIAPTTIVHTGGPNVPPESVSVVPDSSSGYTAIASVSVAGGGQYQVVLTVHAVNQGSAWASSTGNTGQPVGVTVDQE